MKARKTILIKCALTIVSPSCLHMAVPYTKLPSEQ